MSLQVALLILGIVIVISVAVGTMGQSRRVRQHRHRHTDFDDIRNDTVEFEHEYDPSAEVEPVPWVSAPLQGKKSLSSKGTVTGVSQPSIAHKEKNPIYDELETIERAVETRIDVDPEIDTRNLDSEAAPTATQMVMHPMAPDEKIDFIVTLPARSKPISRDRALGIYKQNEYILEKPRGLYGLRNVTRVWSNLDSDPISTEYTDLRLAIQLADIEGPVNESELHNFTQLALKLADPLKRRTLFSMEFDQAIEMAKVLDNFCKEFDVVASVNILSKGPVGFTGMDILHEMSVLGLEIGKKNIFHKYPNFDKRKFPLYSIANLYDPGEFNMEAMQRFVTKGLTIFMQVPCVRDPGTVFREMIKDALHLCNELNGTLLDQDNKPMNQQGVEAIENQIRALDQRMRERGIAPGTETAIRLFDI
jgi:cell division protein ZipA